METDPEDIDSNTEYQRDIIHEFERGNVDQDTNTVMAMKATSDADSMYYHQAMKQDDRKEFTKACDADRSRNPRHL